MNDQKWKSLVDRLTYEFAALELITEDWLKKIWTIDLTPDESIEALSRAWNCCKISVGPEITNEIRTSTAQKLVDAGFLSLSRLGNLGHLTKAGIALCVEIFGDNYNGMQ